MGQLFTPPFQTTLDTNANAVPGARLTFYLSGTTTPAPVYADAALTTPLSSPVIADAAGRFVPIYLDNRLQYRVIVADAGGAPIRDVDPIGDSFAADLADGEGLDYIGFLQEGDGAVPDTALGKARRTVDVFDFLNEDDKAAVKDGATFPDVTYAFTAAIAASRHVNVPPGGYGLIGWRAVNGATLNGANDESCVIKQLDPTVPALNILSDASVGQLKGLSITGLKVIGADEFASPTAYAAAVAGGLSDPAPAVFVGASGAYAIWDSEFRFFAKNTYRAIETLGTDAGNVYQCRFSVTSEGTRGEAAYLRGGGYSEFFLFLTQCDTWAVDASCGNSRIRAITENCQRYTGQMNEIWSIVEGIIVSSPASLSAIYDNGFNNVYHTPTVNLHASDAGKLSFAFRPFSGTVYINPQIVGPTVARPLFPFADCFYDFTIINSRGATAGRIEDYYNDSDPNRTMSKVTLIGNVADFTAYRQDTREVVYLPASGAVAAGVRAGTGFVVVRGLVDPVPSLTIAFAVTPYEGQMLEFSSDKAVTTVTWPAGAAYADLPSSLAANTPLRIVYSVDAGKFLRI